MKYIDSEKLIAEIERRIEEYNIQSLRGAELSDLLSFITSLQHEQPEVDLDALVDEAFYKYSSVDRYGHLFASFNRAELYSFIKKITRKEEENEPTTSSKSRD